jgi:hypothetical protein
MKSQLRYLDHLTCSRNQISKYVQHARFQVLTGASMKIAFFWVVTPCSLGEVDDHPDDGGSKHL